MPCPRLCRQRRVMAVLCLGVLVMLLYRFITPPPVIPITPAPTPRGKPYHDHFGYLLNGRVCGIDDLEGEPLWAVIVVHSDPRRPEVRQAIRDSLPVQELTNLGMRRAFMVANASAALYEGETTISQDVLEKESETYGDIVQGDFHDSYHNLTYKHIMALDWAVTMCPQAVHIVKMDDDIVYNAYELFKVLHLIPPANYLGGNAFPPSPPYRDHSKWIVSAYDWPYALYPPYVSGWLYITTQDVAKALVVQSTKTPFFWIDDLFVTGMLAKQLNITIRGLNKLFVTSADCVRRTVEQVAGPEPPDVVYKSNFVFGPTDHDMMVLKTFNHLSRYCEHHQCTWREPHLKGCVNSLSWHS